MKSTPILAAALSCVLVLSACGTTGFRSSSNSQKDQRSANASDPINNEKGHKRSVEFKGTIVYYKSHGGHYMISSDRGDAYRPVNLPSHYRKAGLRVWVKGVIYDSDMRGYAWDLKIDDIDRL